MTIKWHNGLLAANEIIKLIDSIESFKRYAIYLASESSPGTPGSASMLGDSVQGWILEGIEHLKRTPGQTEKEEFLYSLLDRLCDTIPDTGWRQIADHYLTQLAEAELDVPDGFNYKVHDPLATRSEPISPKALSCLDNLKREQMADILKEHRILFGGDWTVFKLHSLIVKYAQVGAIAEQVIIDKALNT